MRVQGKITAWHDQKGYGFISPVAGGGRVFVHIKAIANRTGRPGMGALISYVLSTDKQGRPCATKAMLLDDRFKPKSSKGTGRFGIISALVFLSVVGICVWISMLPPAILGLYLLASLLAYAFYAVDKSAAKKGAWRIAESTLHLLALFGGWPGALVAQQTLRHKSQKLTFRRVFWVTVLLNGGVFVWVLTPDGAALLRSLGRWF